MVKLRNGEYIALGNIEAVLKTSPLCDNLCIFADQNEMACVAVAVVNGKKIEELAKSLRIGKGENNKMDVATLCKNKEINQAVLANLKECATAGKLTRVDTPIAVYLETEPWLPETGLVTDALKLKRKVSFLKKPRL